ncbi:MAG TPA: hypothetical protein VFP46_02805 [Candidatus Paceibacterota bacterium]|nr:hypothetical protein [Candidatus Paceibacterota bacterium]
MGFFDSLFHSGKKAESHVLIDVDGSTVGGAVVVYKEGEPPIIAYSRRMQVPVRENEQADHAMLRTLDMLGATLVSEGAPALARITGTGRADDIRLLIGAPWQKSVVRVDHYEKAEPFEFTPDLMRESTKADGTRAPGKLIIEEHMLGVYLNGYRTVEPLGKKATRVRLIIMASLIDERAASGITAHVRSMFHSDHIRVEPASSMRLEALHAAFRHQKDALVVDATGPEPIVGLVRDGIPTAIESVPHATAHEGWKAPMRAVLGSISKKYPLPLTVFFIPGSKDSDAIQKSFSTELVRSLWLMHEPPKIIVIQPGHFTPHIRLGAGVEPDLKFFLASLYHQPRA